VEGEGIPRLARSESSILLVLHAIKLLDMKGVTFEFLKNFHLSRSNQLRNEESFKGITGMKIAIIAM
jgi:hypothetical protein